MDKLLSCWMVNLAKWIIGWMVKYYYKKKRNNPTVYQCNTPIFIFNYNCCSSDWRV